MASSRDFNKPVIKAKMYAKTFFFISRCNMIFLLLFLERFGRMHKNKIFFIIIFLMSWWKPDILMPDLYLYNIKIQTDIDQNEVKTLQKNHRFFWNIFEEFFLAGPMWLGWNQQAWSGHLPKPVTRLAFKRKRAWTIHARLLQPQSN